MNNKEVMDKRDLVDELATTRNNKYTGWSKYECDPLNFKSHQLHWRDMLLLSTFESKNWCQRSDILDKEMDQRRFDYGISQYSILHANANMDSIIFFLYPLDFVGFKLYHELHFYATTNMIEPILMKLWLSKLWLWNPSSQHQFLPSHNYNNIQHLAVIFTSKHR